jgi:hypothetical protein
LDDLKVSIDRRNILARKDSILRLLVKSDRPIPRNRFRRKKIAKTFQERRRRKRNMTLCYWWWVKK